MRRLPVVHLHSTLAECSDICKKLTSFMYPIPLYSNPFPLSKLLTQPVLPYSKAAGLGCKIRNFATLFLAGRSFSSLACQAN